MQSVGKHLRPMHPEETLHWDKMSVHSWCETILHRGMWNRRGKATGFSPVGVTAFMERMVADQAVGVGSMSGFDWKYLQHVRTDYRYFVWNGNI